MHIRNNKKWNSLLGSSIRINKMAAICQPCRSGALRDHSGSALASQRPDLQAIDDSQPVHTWADGDSYSVTRCDRDVVEENVLISYGPTDGIPG